jgi:hypothetical protein
LIYVKSIVMITEKDYGKVAGIILVMAVMTIPFQFSFLLWIYESRYADDLEVRVAVHTGP